MLSGLMSKFELVKNVVCPILRHVVFECPCENILGIIGQEDHVKLSYCRDHLDTKVVVKWYLCLLVYLK